MIWYVSPQGNDIQDGRKPGTAFKTLGRFVINSTIGVAGLFDLASKKPFGLEYARL